MRFGENYSWDTLLLTFTLIYIYCFGLHLTKRFALYSRFPWESNPWPHDLGVVDLFCDIGKWMLVVLIGSHCIMLLRLVTWPQTAKSRWKWKTSGSLWQSKRCQCERTFGFSHALIFVKWIHMRFMQPLKQFSWDLIKGGARARCRSNQSAGSPAVEPDGSAVCNERVLLITRETRQRPNESRVSH